MEVHTRQTASVVSAGSAKLEADIPASCTDSFFCKPPQSGMAEKKPLMANEITVSNVSESVSASNIHIFCRRENVVAHE